MLALGIRYLNGFVAACDPSARVPGAEQAEWPPHPARVFMAMAAAHFETEAATLPEERAAEREALLWLESLPPPQLHASDETRRAVVTHYVPVNDEPVETKKPSLIQSFPQLTRKRVERTFVRAWLNDDLTYLIWPEATPADAIRKAVAGLCAKVTRIGHSMSLVQMWVADPEEVAAPTWVPDDARPVIGLRVSAPGTLVDLERRFNRGAVETYAALKMIEADGSDRAAQREARSRLRAEFGDREPQRLRPLIPFYQGYARPEGDDAEEPPPGSVFSPHLLTFALERENGPYATLDLLSAPAIAQRWREALVSRSNDLSSHAREVLSGHDAGGSPLEGPHLAFLPLAFVGHPHADGHLLGFALALPQGLDGETRRALLRAVGRVDRLLLGGLGVWRLMRPLAAQPLWSLRPEAWTAHPHGASHWSTVTPLAFDRHPKAKDRREAHREQAEMIAAACAAIGLPRPREVIVTHVSAHLGVPTAPAFPRLRRKDGSERRHAHAILVFDEPVVGPVLIGAGRYRGYGVCRPLDDPR